MISDFLEWLDARLDSNEGEGSKHLKSFISDRNSAIWQSGLIDEARTLVEQYATDNQTPDVVKIFDASWQDWQQREQTTSTLNTSITTPSTEAPATSKPRQRLDKFSQVVNWTSEGGAITLLSIILILLLAIALFDKQLLGMLGDVAIARGLITFLFAVGTIGIAVLMVSALFLADKSELKERFEPGKEVLTALIAILGTVVGFYFGSANLTPSAGLQPIAVSKPIVLSTQAGFDLAAFITGGKPPYSYSIKFKSAEKDVGDILEDISEEANNGLISEAIILPTGATGIPLALDIEISDTASSSIKIMDLTVFD